MIKMVAFKLLNIINRHKLWPPLILAIVCIILYLKVISGLDKYDYMYEATKFGTRNAFLIGWGLLTFIYFRELIYKKKTGRIYAIDKLKFEDKSYLQLMDTYKDAEPYKIDPKTLPKEDWQTSEGIVLGRYKGGLIKRSAFEKGGEGVNVGVFGLPGTGKTATILIVTALIYGGSILCLDIKGDILSATKNKRNIKIFAPDDPDNSYHYNPLSGFYGLRENDDKTEYIENIAAILVPKEREKYWYQTGRALFCGISFIVLDKKPRATLPDIAKAILKSDADEWIRIIKVSDCELAQLYTNTLFGSSVINLQGAYGSLANVVRPFSTGRMSRLLNDDGDAISPIDLDRGYDVYIEIPEKKISTYSFITTIIVQQFMDSFRDRPDKSANIRQQPVLFMLDEFPRLHFDFETISSAMSTFRSKCVSVMTAMQSISQLTNAYGPNAMDEFVDLLHYFAIISAQNPRSRDFFKELIGDKKVLKASSGNGYQETREYIFQSADFANLGDNVIIYDNGKYILAEKIYWYKEFEDNPTLSLPSPDYDSISYDNRDYEDFLVGGENDESIYL